MRKLTSLILLSSLSLCAQPAYAQQMANPCGTFEEMQRALSDYTISGRKYSEKRVATGLDDQHGMRMDLFVDRKNGTWSVLYTNPNPPNPSTATCMVGSGEAWEDLP